MTRRPAVLVVLALLTWPGTASAERFDTAGPAIASPGSDEIVAVAGANALTVRDASGTRTLALSDGCRPVAVAPGTVFCEERQADLRTGVVTPTPHQRITSSPTGIERLRVTAAGSRWLAGEIDLSSQTHSSPITVSALVSRADGRVINTSRPGLHAYASFGPRRYEDLSGTLPDRALCAPVTRERDAGNRDAFLPLTRVGRWTLRQRRASVSQLRPSFLLQRCGSRRTTSLPRRSAPTTNPVLGPGYAAWLDGRRLRVRNLATGRTRTVAWGEPGATQTTLAASRGAAVISWSSPDPSRWHAITVEPPR